MLTNIPNYADLFGNIDFKKGDEFRSVYSPAAYLVDLLQLLDDEFSDISDFKEDRRSDLYEIDLDAENTTTLIPYLDIVNEVLEGRINSENVYETLENAAYPFNMPFSLDNEKVKNHLHHLGISAHELRSLFATTTDYTTVAREYLGLSTAEWDKLLTAAADDNAVFDDYGYTATEDTETFIQTMSVVSTFLETTDLEAQEILELLYQNLYIEPSDHSIVEDGRENFFINTGITGYSGYVTLNTDETELEWYDTTTETSNSVPIDWFDRTSRFVRLAQKTGLSFTELDRILRHCCKQGTDTPTLDENTLVYLAQVVYIHKTLEQPLDTVVAILSEISYMGRTNNDLPQDQFNRIFNLPCVSIDEKYLHIDDVTGALPHQYEDTTYNTYTPIDYYADLFSDDNDTYRQRLRHALGFTETDLINITERLEFEEVAESSLWEDTTYEWQLLNVLYRIRALSDALDVHFLELFTLFDLLEQDPFIGRYDPHHYFVYNAPSTQKCFEILMAGYDTSADVSSSSVKIYQHIEYVGDMQELLPGYYDSSELENFTNKISSLEVPNGWTVTLYEGENFDGKSVTLTTDTPSLVEVFDEEDNNFNDRTFSIVITDGTYISDKLWLFESLIALTKWMKEFGYSAEMLWAIVNGAPMTDKAALEQEAQDLALYNTLLQSFKAGEIRPDTLEEVLGDERASYFAFSLIHERYGEMADEEMEAGKPPWHCNPGAAKKHGFHKKHRKYKKHRLHKKHGESSMNGDRKKPMAAYESKEIHQPPLSKGGQGGVLPMASGEHQHLLVAYESKEIHQLTKNFIEELATVHDYDFFDLGLEGKLQEKIFKNLVNHQVIDGSGKILLANLVDRQLPPLQEFTLEYDFSEIEQDVFDIFHRIYQEEAAAQLEEGDTIEVQVFKSDFENLSLSTAEIRELYDTLIYLGYIDEEGFATDAEMFGDASNASDLDLYTGLGDITDRVHHVLAVQFDKFAASKVKISEQMFADLDLTPVALKDLLHNLQMNRYIDKQMFVMDKMRIVAETPRTMEIALKFYPHREAICKALKDAIATDQETWLKVDRGELGKIAAQTVSRWVYEDLQEYYLDGNELNSEAIAFFKEESNRDSLTLSAYFDPSQEGVVFDRLAGIVKYADQYYLQDSNLTALDFNDEEIQALKQNLTAIGVLNEQGLLEAEQVPFFLMPENAANFDVPGFEDYDREVFFQLYDIAKAIDDTVKAVDKALKDHSESQQTAIVEQLQGVLGIDADAVKALSKAIFKTEDNLHFDWLEPLLADANALGHLDELPNNMHYTQAVKRIRQLALLIKQQQLDINEIELALEDQALVAKFPEDLTLPDEITSVDALLATEEFIYFFKDDYYWIYLAKDYIQIDKKDLDLENEDDRDLLDLQKEDEALQKRLKEDPIRQLFEEEELSQVDAAFIDRYGTWVVVSDTSHYVKYADRDAWDKRDNNFGQVDNDFENLEMIDSAYVDSEGRLFLFANDKYVRYSDLTPGLSELTVDKGYPKSIAEDWNQENLTIQLPPSFGQDLGPMFDGVDDRSYAFLGDRYLCSEDGKVRPVAEKWGHREYNFGHPTQIDAALASQGNYFLFLNNKIAKYTGSIELANLQPEDGYPKGIHQEFTDLPDEFVSGIHAALGGWDDTIYLFQDDEYVTITIDNNTGNRTTSEAQETREMWGKVANDIASEGKVDAAFVGLDGYTYLFSGEQYVRYSGSDYSQVDDGFPRNITEDWEGLTEVTGAFVLGNKTYLFGTNVDDESVYVRYSTLPEKPGFYVGSGGETDMAGRNPVSGTWEVDEEDPNARVIETVLANRPDVDEIEVFPATVNDDFWSLPDSVTNGDEDFQIDAVMNGPDGKVYLFYGDLYIEHDRNNRWWSEPKVLSEQWDRAVTGLDDEQVVAAFMGKDGKTYLFYTSKFLRFSDAELYNVDYGYPRLIRKFWGKVRNNIERTGKVDAALIVESRWEEQDEDGQLVDMTAEHTYLFSGDQFFRYVHEDGDYNYETVEQGYPRSIHRLKEEPRFRELKTAFPEGIDAAFADRRQVYLFKGNSFHVVIGDEDNYKQYGENDTTFTDVKAVAQEGGVNYLLIAETDTETPTNTWYKVNHLEDRIINKEEATPRIVQRAEDILVDDAKAMTDVDAVLHGSDGKSYVFAGSKYYDVELEKSFAIADVWGRSRNPIYDQETIDAAFVGRDGVTYVFSGEWFVQYDTETYIEKTVTYPPRRISDKWQGLNNVALAYVWKEDTFLFERPDVNGNFRYLHYTKDSYEKPGRLYQGDDSLWDIPTAYKREGFDLADGEIDAIFASEDNLIFISDRHFISLNLNSLNWSVPQPLDLLYPGIPFNKTDFKTLKSGFVGKDSTVYLFSQERYAAYDDNSDNWTDVFDIKAHWGWQNNILSDGVDAAWINPSDRTTYLFAGDEYVRYSSSDYRYVDEGYPKEIATYLRDEPAFAFMTKEFQQHLDELEENYDSTNPTSFFDGLLDNGRCLYFFTENTVFTGSPNKYVVYEIDGLGQVENNFTLGGYVDAAFVTEVEKNEIFYSVTYLFSGEQYIRYTVEQDIANDYRGDYYRYIDEGYPKIIRESFLAEETDLGVEELSEDYRNGIDAAFYSADLGLMFFNEKNYLNVDTSANNNRGDINEVWGHLDNTFTSNSDSQEIDGAYVDEEGGLIVFKGKQFVRYSDTDELFALNPYDDPRYVDEEFPRDIDEIWPQLDETILTDTGVDTVFKFEEEIYFHTGENFVTYNLDMTDHDEEKPVKVLAYRWGEWSDYLLSDIHAITRFKDLNQGFTGGDLTLTELVTGANGEVKEPYMAFAAIFGFEKEEVRWVKQHNAFLADPVNVVEEDFELELILRLYDILATTQRLRVDVSAFYNDVWVPLYDGNYWIDDRPDVATAATGAYDLLVSVDCNNNYETLVKQITNELNTIQRDALVPYVIAHDDEVSTTRQLYQKLLIDIQMHSVAETSRIKEAISAVQLYMHRYFMNLEDIDLDASDRDAMRKVLKERWEWLQNYRVWEANRKVFLYPENYIRPELRDPDDKSAAFEALESSLNQGQLTEDFIEEAYFNYLDSYTEVSELTIAGGYVYDDSSSGTDDKVLVLFGRTRTDPMRYYYRFATFVNSDSSSITWQPWQELNINIEATQVRPVYAFNRVFVFWTTIEESSEDPSSAIVSSNEENTEFSSSGNSQQEIKVYYSFYNLNERWSQPQLLDTSFNDSETISLNDESYTLTDLKTSLYISNEEIVVENSNKLSDDDYENIYINVSFYVSDTYGDSTPIGPYVRAYNLTPELYSQKADTQNIENQGQYLFNDLFPNEGGIDADNVVMLSSTNNSMDGAWFAYNHKGCGFLIKPDAEPLDSSTTLKTLSEYDILSVIPSGKSITAAVQVFEGQEVYYFLHDETYITVSANDSGGFTASEATKISDRWGWAYNGLDDDVAPELFSTTSSTLKAYKNFLENVIATVDLEKIFLSKDDRDWTDFEEPLSNESSETISNAKTWLENSVESSLETVDAAYVADDSLYLISGTEYYRYTLDGSIPFLADNDFPISYTVAVSDTELQDLDDEKADLTSAITTLKETKTDNLDPLLTDYLITLPGDSGFNDTALSSYPNLLEEYQVNEVVAEQTNDEDGSTEYTYAGYSTTLQDYIDTLENPVEQTLDGVNSLEDLENIVNELNEVIDALNYFQKTVQYNITANLLTVENSETRTDAYEKWSYLSSDLTNTATNLQGIVDNIETITNSTETLSNSIDAALVLEVDSSDSTNSNYYVYLFSGTEYYRLSKNTAEPTLGVLDLSLNIVGSWGNLPSEIRSSGLDAAFKYVDSNNTVLYLIQGSQGYEYDWTTYQPYEINSVMYEAIRLTSSTAEKLNQILFAGTIGDFLQMATQEINESPTISTETSSPDNIQIDSDRFKSEPINSHLDFNSANGLYYWELFFHAPFLIAQTLNTDQQFEYAKEWYEYIFDPTEVSDYWKFLPFLAVDPDALIATLGNDLDAFEAISTEVVTNDEDTTVDKAQQALVNLAADLYPYQNVFLGKTDLDIYEDSQQDQSGLQLANIENWETFTNLDDAIQDLSNGLSNSTINATSGTTSDNELLTTWVSEMQEVLEIIKKLEYRHDLMNNYSTQLAVYFEDPFDPHAIATLRPLAYRKAIVMAYIDNLLDWGDMLFRQYTHESINEARMLYILAYDILGEKPKNIGRVVLEKTKTYNELGHYTGAADYNPDSETDLNPDSEEYEDYDFLIDLENTTTSWGAVEYEQSLSFAATQFDTITNPYFYLKENELFTEYWNRVEDRLAKIRACLNIDGVAQPLPLFQPPIDPMALVSAVAGGASIAGAAAMAMGAGTVPDYRFSSMMAKARDLLGKVKGFGDALLSALEKKDAEELSLLQNKQESVIQDMMTPIKEEQIKEAEVSLSNLEESKRSAEQQERHYTDLINTGYLPQEKTQIDMMLAAAAIHGSVVLAKILSGLSYIYPQVTLGAFSFGVTSGGRNVGAMLGKFGESTESIAEGLSMGGEVAGVMAQFKRSKEDWKLQKKMATSEITQINYQIEAQKHSITIAKQELLVHQKEIENQQAIAKFMKSKFSNQELYNWMSGKLSGLFYQTYKLAHDYAKQAEQALIFEHGIKAGEVNYIGGMYWDSQKKGLLSGPQLELDLDRMEKAYMEMNSRSLEITKNISLLQTDPMALLALKNKGVCTFRLSEELFDYDFPGHYNRQIKTISLAFDIGEGQTVNATLTQLSNKLVMDTDIKAVKHLINPSNEATTNVRANWRANQQVALSHVDEYTENNGMFELNFGDERYLPFEGTGAVSNWRLELNGMKGSYNPSDLLDVTIKLRYTAKQGGSRFANEVKGVLKPYHATSFFDMAYNFPDEWEALTAGDVDEVEIPFARNMFPNMSSSKIIGLFMRYEYEGSSGAIFTINNDLQVPNNTYLQPNTLSVGQKGTTWTFALNGDRSTLKNAEMILVYKAKV